MVDELGSQRELFDVPDDVAYFNAASLSPGLRSVREAGESALRRRARPRTIGEADWFADVERLRALAGRLVGGDADGIALVPASSYGFAVAAANLPLEAGQQVLVLAGEYPSGVYTWRRATERTGAGIRTVNRAPGQTWTEAVLAAIDERVGIVSVPNVHWTVSWPAAATRSGSRHTCTSPRPTSTASSRPWSPASDTDRTTPPRPPRRSDPDACSTKDRALGRGCVVRGSCCG